MLLLSYSSVNVHTAPKEQQKRVYTWVIKAVKGVENRRFSKKTHTGKSGRNNEQIASPRTLAALQTKIYPKHLIRSFCVEESGFLVNFVGFHLQAEEGRNHLLLVSSRSTSPSP